MSTPKNIADKNNKLFNKRKSPEITLGSEMPDSSQMEYVEMPEWWQKGTNTKGLPFRKIVVIAGDSDSGKTSFSIDAIKQAVEQGVSVLYVETEGKTTKEDFVSWGVDPSKIYFTSDSIAEDIYSRVITFLRGHKDKKFLVIIDSLGNVLSKHDSERDLATTHAKPGGKGKANREGLNSLIALRTQQDIALVVITYTYDNLGSPGKTNAGGKAVNFYNCLCYQTSRKSWIERTVAGKKIRKGARVQWKLFKNHIDRANPGPKVIELDITSDGIALVGASDEFADE